MLLFIFVTRQKRTKKRAWGRTPMSPHVVACYTQKSYRFFAQSHAALTSQNPCFRRLKEDGENGELPPERKLRYQTNIFPRSFRLRMTAIFYSRTLQIFSTSKNSKRSHLPKNFRPIRTKSAQSRGIYKGAAPPLYTFSLVHFFGVSQRNEQQTYYR